MWLWYCKSYRSREDKELLVVARGAEALIEAASMLEDDASLFKMFMGREPFVLEIKGQ